MTNPPGLVFIHIPKTAGNSVLNALKSLYDPTDISPFLIEGRTDTAQWPNYRLVAGHIGFLAAQQFGMAMITVVREPVERTVSLYNFWRHGRTPMREILETMSFEEFLKSDHPVIVVNRDNMQTWQLALSLQPKLQRESSLSGEALLERAIENLEKIAVVGATERLELFASRFSAAFGVDLPALAHANKTRKRSQSRELSAEAQEIVHNITDLDRRLYQHILSRAES